MLNVGDQGRKAKEFLQRIQKEKDQNKDVSSQDLLLKNLLDRKNLLDLNIIVGLDISGSISSSQFAQFIRQVNAIKGLSRVKIIETDTCVQSYYDFSLVNNRRNIAKLGGGGGTDFTEAFDAIEKIKPDAVLFMTDGFVSGNPQKPSMPVGWILTHDGVNPYGFGEIVYRLGQHS